jgi:hypothetical protein
LRLRPLHGLLRRFAGRFEPQYLLQLRDPPVAIPPSQIGDGDSIKGEWTLA